MHEPRALEEVGQRANSAGAPPRRRRGARRRPQARRHARQRVRARSSPRGRPSCRSRRARDGAVLDPAGEVPLGGNRVVVAGEHDERASALAAAPRGRRRRLVRRARTRRDERPRTCAAISASSRLSDGMFDELERAGGEPVGESGHRRQAWHNPRVTTRQHTGSSPNAGLCSPCSPQSADAEEELGELRELARTAGVEPIASSCSSGAARTAHVRRQGQARGAEAGLRGRGRGGAARRRRARAVAAAGARERPHGARRRPDAADPRHLRPARDERRGKASGRARAARVQPAAHARHVAAPRAPRRRYGRARRRRRHARPGRVAARDRPPDRAPQDLAPAPPAARTRQAARDTAEGARAAAARRPSRSPGTRTSASRRS